MRGLYARLGAIFGEAAQSLVPVAPNHAYSVSLRYTDGQAALNCRTAHGYS
jgi:hypothetical protein